MTDDQLEDTLKDWGSHVELPSRDVAGAVRARIDSDRNRTILGSPLWLRRVSVGVAAFAAIVVVLLSALMFSQMTPSRSRPPVAAGNATAKLVLTRAARIHPAGHQIMHLIYMIRIQSSVPARRRINVWQQYRVRGYNSLLIESVRDEKVATRLVETSGRVRRVWTSRPGLTSRELRTLIGTSPVEEDGRLTARLLLEGLRRQPDAIKIVGRRKVSGVETYELRVLQSFGRVPIGRVYYSTRTYGLVAVRGSGYRERLVHASSIPLSATPQSVVSYFRKRPSPFPEGQGAAY